MQTNFNSQQLLQQMQSLNKLAKAGAVESQSGIQGIDGVSNNGSVADKGDFGNLLTRAINSVNSQQMEASRLASQVETGDGGVSLVKAMIASQKSGIAFQATMQVRNKIVSAYQDIMNMPI
ncbi:MAG: flagellar hook-basal body complex protein FliE [Kangiellaceae bacterium]